ncbi:hypothetical protein JCM5353_008059 [Sporobolomyces roseus]
MVNFPLSSKFSFSSSHDATPSTTSSGFSSRSRTEHRFPSPPAPKSPPTTALSIFSDLTNNTNSSNPFPLSRRPAKRPKTAEGYTSFSDLLSIPPCVLDREMEKSEREREQREKDRQDGKDVGAETPWTAPPTPDPYFLPYRPSQRNNHSRSLSDPSNSIVEVVEPTRISPTRPGFSRTQTDPGSSLSLPHTFAHERRSSAAEVVGPASSLR